MIEFFVQARRTVFLQGADLTVCLAAKLPHNEACAKKASFPSAFQKHHPSPSPSPLLRVSLALVER